MHRNKHLNLYQIIFILYSAMRHHTIKEKGFLDMFHKYILVFLLGILTACNHVHMKPGTLDKNEVFYVDSGGGLTQLGMKQLMEERGYNLTVGHKRTSVKTSYITAEGAESIISESDVGKAKYLVFISESVNKFRPVWCSLNGFWWLRFNVSITDNATGQELLHWTGRGCANSTLRKLDRILDKLEK